MIAFGIEQLLEMAMRSTRAGRVQQAETLCRQVLAQQPENVDALHMLGEIAYRLGHLDAAVDLLRKAVAADPSIGIHRGNLAEALRVVGKLDEALHEANEGVRLCPENFRAWITLSAIYMQTDRGQEALEAAHKAVALAPRDPAALTILGMSLMALDRFAEAIDQYRAAIAVDPKTLRYNLGLALARMGKLDEAIAEFRQALELESPAHPIHSNLVYTLLHHPNYGPLAVFQEHLEWARRYAEPLKSEIHPHVNSRDPGRRLRIGYVSPNLHTHAVSFFIEPILAHHDHTEFEIVGYHDHPLSDAVTERLRSGTDIWREIIGLDDKQLADMVRQDQIDIFVDLNGHLPRNRLLTFARKPAPVQVTYIGYQTTTGLSTMDYRITDAVADPPGQTDAFHTEKLVRLPLFFAYKPLEASPAPRGLPLDRKGRLTLGSMNNFVKIGPQVIALWSRILKALPDARLLVLIPGGAKGNEHVLEAFGRHGIDSSRITLEPHRGVAEYLDLFNEIDITLDAFPFSGHTTICDALWMGVPVVTLLGQAYAGRMAASVLTSAGLTDWITMTPDEYERKVLALAADFEGLRSWHETLRARFQASPTMDGRDFTRNLEAAYRRMWQAYCQTAP